MNLAFLLLATALADLSDVNRFVRDESQEAVVEAAGNVNFVSRTEQSHVLESGAVVEAAGNVNFVSRTEQSHVLESGVGPVGNILFSEVLEPLGEGPDNAYKVICDTIDGEPGTALLWQFKTLDADAQRLVTEDPIYRGFSMLEVFKKYQGNPDFLQHFASFPENVESARFKEGFEIVTERYETSFRGNPGLVEHEKFVEARKKMLKPMLMTVLRALDEMKEYGWVHPGISLDNVFLADKTMEDCANPSERMPSDDYDEDACRVMIGGFEYVCNMHAPKNSGSEPNVMPCKDVGFVQGMVYYDVLDETNSVAVSLRSVTAMVYEIWFGEDLKSEDAKAEAIAKMREEKVDFGDEKINQIMKLLLVPAVLNEDGAELVTELISNFAKSQPWKGEPSPVVQLLDTRPGNLKAPKAPECFAAVKECQKYRDPLLNCGTDPATFTPKESYGVSCNLPKELSREKCWDEVQLVQLNNQNTPQTVEGGDEYYRIKWRAAKTTLGGKPGKEEKWSPAGMTHGDTLIGNTRDRTGFFDPTWQPFVFTFETCKARANYKRVLSAGMAGRCTEPKAVELDFAVAAGDSSCKVVPAAEIAAQLAGEAQTAANSGDFGYCQFGAVAKNAIFKITCKKQVLRSDLCPHGVTAS